jgi:hypothetical protein
VGICRFKTDEVLPLIKHALAAKDFSMGYESMPDEEYIKLGLEPPKNRLPPQPALLFVHDSGVYLMSNGTPRKETEVAYAEGCNPSVGEFDDWYGKSRELVGGDDFVEVLCIGPDWSADCENFDFLELNITPESIFQRWVKKETATPAINEEV